MQNTSNNTPKEKKRCLVTGGAGFIASHVVDRLVEEGHPVAILDNMTSGKREHIPEGVPLYKQDLTAPLDSVFEKEQPQVVFHHAAQVSVSRSVREPEFDGRDNVLGTIHLLEACRKYNVKRIIYASSGAAYGEPKSLPLREDDHCFPLSPYGISKYTVEYYLYYYRHQFNIEYAALRYANVYGPRQDPHGEAGVVSIFTEQMMGGEQAVIFGDGNQTRDFIFVKDVAEANLAAMRTDFDPSILPVFNVSSQIQTPLIEIFDYLNQFTGANQPRIHGPKRDGDVYHACLANEKIKTHLHWKPQYTLEQGLRETVDYFKHQTST